MHKTLVVVDESVLGEFSETPGIAHLNVITFDQYLQDYPKLNEPRTRIINVCDTVNYLSKGYYCSLLAEARNHKVLPSVKTINELRIEGQADTAQLSFSLSSQMQGEADVPQELFVYFGLVANVALQKLARKLYERFPAPILRVVFDHQGESVNAHVRRSSYQELDEINRARFIEALASFTDSVWRKPSQRKAARWDMAILVNPDEPHPPSDKEAIARFVKAAKKLNIYAEPVTSQQLLLQLNQFDALFIRETTAIDHPTYRLARKAESAGLVVMDDPDSILRCCNKVFLHDAFSYHGVPSLKTHVVMNVDETTLDGIEQQFDYPLVLKMPEGSFSNGVYKAADRAALRQRLTELFQQSALVLVQEYLYTDFDWRIGVLNGRAIYACRYHMARNHWQIYNHSAKRFSSGGFETLPTFEVPKPVLDAAVKAANVVGKGLYGVDLKQKDGHVYVIEVNDNPSVDHKVEDAYLGNELYMLVMAEFQRRLELRGR
ncbi:RimK family protein [Aestuariicella hydrocarbonica]|uniref:RimK family protein n=1 Tax=Pseudomaricurvus hydrocarbonicus TaxID=1470433 RepID=A0A9E5MLF9_9GAMM|nr:RimK family protein [Aestuariicella hydrocarbonica]NHO66967.1 RimK family protein [Aestuariicella hydrocarbonica]